MPSSEELALGLVLVFFQSALSASAGVGGGSINVAIYMIVFQSSFHVATGLSLCTLMGNYMVQVAINLNKKHPLNSTRSIIYWEAVLVLLPSELGGSNIGVIIANMFPDTVLYILALFVACVALWVSFMKGMQYYRQERLDKETTSATERAMLLPGASNPQTYDSPYGALNSALYDGTDHSGPGGAATNVTDEQGFTDFEEEMPPVTSTDALLDMKKFWKEALCCMCYPSAGQPWWQPEINYPWLIIFVLVGAWGLYCICYMVMKQYAYCTLGYDLSLGVVFVVLIVEIIWGVWYVLSRRPLKRKASSPEIMTPPPSNDSNGGSAAITSASAASIARTCNGESEADGYELPQLEVGDINWWQSASLLLLTASFFIGVLSALLGFGGGELMAPMMLYMQMLPQVVSATTSMMSFFNTSSSVIHYLSLGIIPTYLGIYVFIVGTLGGLVGRLSALYVATRYKRPSVFVFSLVAVMLVSLALYLKDLIETPTDFAFSGTFCV